MIWRQFLPVALLALIPVRVTGQATLDHGDLLISTLTPPGGATVLSRIVIYGRDGSPKGEVTSSNTNSFRETIVRNGIIFVGTRTGIQRIDPAGAVLPPFNDVRNIVWMSPALDGSILASNGSGETYHFNADGSIRIYRSIFLNDPTAAGIDLSPDQCTAYYLASARLVRWDICLNTTPTHFGPSRPNPTSTAMRLLPDGTFLTAYLSNIAHLDSGGNVIRTYGIPGRALALDVDQTSFWTGAGSALLKVDIESGVILLLVNTPEDIEYLGVVGEPRASLRAAMTGSIPTLSTIVPLLFVVSLSLVAALRLR